MIEVDIFWSFAIGSSLASAYGHLLKHEAHPLVNEFFLYTVLFLSLVFAPSGVYLLWQFPHWETMFLFHYPSLHGIFPCIFALTNVLFGIGGFYMTWNLIRKPKVNHFLVTLLWTGSYSAMFGILGFGYRRFFYPGTYEDWHSGKHFPLTAFFQSEVFFTLIGMGIVLLPCYYYPLCAWPLQSTSTNRTGNTNSKTLDDVGFTSPYYFLLTTVFATLIGVIGFICYILSCSETERLRISDIHGPFGYFAPVVGFVTAQLAFIVLGGWPVLFAASNKSNVVRHRKTS